MHVIVMAGQGFTDAAGEFHPWGQEYEITDESELADLLARKVVREDDRAAIAAAQAQLLIQADAVADVEEEEDDEGGDGGE